MGHSGHLDLEGTDLQEAWAQGLDIECRRREPGLIVERIESGRQLGRTDDTNPSARHLPPKVVPKRHKIHEVVGMEVADQDGIEGRRIQQASQPSIGSLTEIQQYGMLAMANQVGGARSAGSIGVRRSGTDDGEPHELIWPAIDH